MAREDYNRGIGGRSVTAVVPAYNEAPRLGAVLSVLSTYPGFREVIVVDDGSTDETGKVAAEFGARVLRNEENMGKGHSMDRGVKAAETDIIFFSDADITGLSHATIEEITAPVLQGSADMFIGMISRRWYIVHQMLTFVPLLGGERAITKSLWNKVPEYYKQHFRIEVALNFFSIYYGRGYKYAVLPRVAQTIKEEKYGLFEGLKARVRMLYNIFSAQLRLNWKHVPRAARTGRLLALLALYSIAGLLAGGFIFLALYFGPSAFIRFVFAKDLHDPSALLAPFLLELARFTPIDTIALTGLLVFISSLVILILTWKNLNYLWYGLQHKLKGGDRTPEAP